MAPYPIPTSSILTTTAPDKQGANSQILLEKMRGLEHAGHLPLPTTIAFSLATWPGFDDPTMAGGHTRNHTGTGSKTIRMPSSGRCRCIPCHEGTRGHTPHCFYPCRGWGFRGFVDWTAGTGAWNRCENTPARAARAGLTGGWKNNNAASIARRIEIERMVIGNRVPPVCKISFMPGFPLVILVLQ